MNKSFSSLGTFGGQYILRQAVKKGGCNLDRVHQLPYRVTGMRTHTVNRNGNTISRKSFILIGPAFSSIERIGKISGEFLKIYPVYSTANLFIRSKQQFNRSMFHFRVGNKKIRQIHNYSHTR